MSTHTKTVTITLEEYDTLRRIRDVFSKEYEEVQKCLQSVASLHSMSSRNEFDKCVRDAVRLLSYEPWKTKSIHHVE